MIRSQLLPVVVLASLLGCAQHDPQQTALADHAPGTSAAPATTATPSAENGMHDDLADDEALAAEKFGDGAKAFAKVKETLLANYYSEGITEDDVYRAATAG